MAFIGLARAAEPRELERFGSRRDGRILLEDAAEGARRAGRDGLGQAAGLRCRRTDGTVGSVTAFPGGFTLSEPQCAVVRVRVRGHRFVYNRLVSFGMGQVSGNCDKL